MREVWDPLDHFSKEGLHLGIGINEFLELSENSDFKMIKRLEIYL
jgi:hypothetical protein